MKQYTKQIFPWTGNKEVFCFKSSVSSTRSFDQIFLLFAPLVATKGKGLSFFVTKLPERHVVALQVLCSFLASLPHAEGISCYSCLEYPGSNQTCSNPSIIQCGPYYDSCVDMNVTSNIMGIHSSAALKNCSISNPQCNSSYVCGLVNSSISQSGGTLLSCSLNCCYGDLCNGQGGGGILYLFF